MANSAATSRLQNPVGVSLTWGGADLSIASAVEVYWGRSRSLPSLRSTWAATAFPGGMKLSAYSFVLMRRLEWAFDVK